MKNKQLFLDHLNKNKTLIDDFNESGSQLYIWRSEPYLWLSIDGEQVQSIVDTSDPSRPILPVPQAMLIWTIWQNKLMPSKILNIGMGTGTIERYLAGGNYELTSIESSKRVISITQEHFNLPSKAHIIHTCGIEYSSHRAEQTRTNNKSPYSNTLAKYDVILVDIFENEQTPRDILSHEFYHNCHEILDKGGILVLNLYLTQDQELLAILAHTQHLFEFKCLIDFQDYHNVVLMLSHSPIPEEAQLTQLINSRPEQTSGLTHIKEIISHMHLVS